MEKMAGRQGKKSRRAREFLDSLEPIDDRTPEEKLESALGQFKPPAPSISHLGGLIEYDDDIISFPRRS